MHIHYVIQPVTKAQMAMFGARGPDLQAAMFSRGRTPGLADVERIANQARRLFATP